MLCLDLADKYISLFSRVRRRVLPDVWIRAEHVADESEHLLFKKGPCNRFGPWPLIFPELMTAETGNMPLLSFICVDGREGG